MKHGPDVARWVEWGTRRPVWFIKERLWGWVGREKHWEGRQTGNYLIRGNPKDGTGSWHIIWLGINTSDNKEKWSGQPSKQYFEPRPSRALKRHNSK